MRGLTSAQKNSVLTTMAALIASERAVILKANKIDVENYLGEDIAMYDRLKVDDAKIDGMIVSLQQLIADVDPVGKELYNFTHENGLKMINKTAPFLASFL